MGAFVIPAGCALDPDAVSLAALAPGATGRVVRVGSLDPDSVSLAALAPGATGRVVGVGSGSAALPALERRLLELGFVPGEEVRILTEARPGRDPFVVRVGHTTLALRRCEAQNVFVKLEGSRAGSVP